MMTYILMIDNIGDKAFLVCLAWGFGLLVLLATSGFMINWLEARSVRRERCRRNKNRKGYIHIGGDRRIR